jgi:hypothetical protein
MRRQALLLALLVSGLLACGEKEETAVAVPEGPVEWEVAATADKTTIQVGEDLAVQLIVRHPPDADFIIPTGPELEPFELIERIDEPSTSLVESVITLRMGAYRLPGNIAVPPIKVEYRDESSGEMASVETESIPIELVTSLTPDITDINDIHGPIEDIALPTHWNRLWWLVLALLAALAAYIIYRKLRKDQTAPVEMAPAKPLIPPDIEAEKALRELADKRLLEQGEELEFYIALAEIMKRYAGRRFSVPYLESTTTEILADLKKTRLQFEKGENLKGILIASDIVKFARVSYPIEASERMIPEGFRFVDETRPRVQVEIEASESDQVEARV